MATKHISDIQVLEAYRDAGQRRTQQLERPGPVDAPLVWPELLLEQRTSQPAKVCLSAMRRACQRGLLDYGVSLRSGWITPEGMALLQAQQPHAADRAAQPQGTMNDQQIENEIQAKGLTAPRVTLEDLNANIADTEIVKHVSRTGQVLRWAVLTTRNGFAVVGRPSVAVSPENDRADLGERLAIENARDELWPLMGYELRSKLASSPADFRDRVRLEASELQEKIVKLSTFQHSEAFEQLDSEERDRLEAQYAAMLDYSNALSERIDAFPA